MVKWIHKDSQLSEVFLSGRSRCTSVRGVLVLTDERCFEICRWKADLVPCQAARAAAPRHNQCMHWDRLSLTPRVSLLWMGPLPTSPSFSLTSSQWCFVCFSHQWHFVATGSSPVTERMVWVDIAAQGWEPAPAALVHWWSLGLLKPPQRWSLGPQFLKTSQRDASPLPL